MEFLFSTKQSYSVKILYYFTKLLKQCSFCKMIQILFESVMNPNKLGIVGFLNNPLGGF